MPHGVFPASSKAALALMLFLFAFAALCRPGDACAEPRFGDSTWVAPSEGIAGDPSDPGPRVAPKDHERTWETVLRTPFRVAFLPVRLLARGIEATGPLAERFFPPGSMFAHHAPKPRLKFSPDLIGATVSAPVFAGPGSKATLKATWSLSDTRKLKFRSYVGEGVSYVGAGLEALYERKPNRTFYGIGNSSPSDETFFLRRTELASVYAFVGRNRLRRVRATLGISDMDIGPGYNGAPGNARTADVFNPTTAPFLAQGTRLWWYGASADIAALDDSLAPSSGIHFRPDIKRYQSNDGTGVRYDQWRLEARGYVPVFARRRVLVGRVVYEGVDRRGASAPIPYYRLPESAEMDHFAAYPSGRFRDLRLAIGRVEYRWEIERPISAFLLGELGEVATTASQLSLRAAHPSLGGGLRAKLGQGVGRFEIAHGHEGFAFRIDLGAGF